MTPTLANSPKPNLSRRQVAALSLLAKLLASENIRVQHSARASTASFDTKSRTLTLPVWNAMSGDLYDMLVAHEVGHALYSPKGGEWLKELEKIAGSKVGTFKSYVNIVEDSRIERMMKDAYPGLRSTFARAYRDLTATNPKLFALDRELKSLPLIDRVNIHYKVGFAIDVPFDAKEMALVRRVAETKTWDEVVALAKEFFDFSKSEESSQQQEQPEPQDGEDTPADGEDGESDSDGESLPDNGEEDSDSDNGSSGSDNEEQDGEERGQTADEGADNEDAEDSTEGGEESQGGEEDADGESDSQSDSDSASGSDKQSKGSGDPEDGEPQESVTEKALEQLSKENTNDDRYSGKSSTTVRIPTFNVENGIVPFKEIIEDFRLISERNNGFAKYQDFLAKNRRSVAALVQEFMRRKAADEASRTRTADTGSIDPSRLWAYRVSEEIFGSYEIKKEGKNHGIVFLLDWSGSMNRILKPTIMQLACLVQFCAAANIPCEVYAFSDAYSYRQDASKVWSRNVNEVDLAGFTLLNILSASAKPAEIKTAIAGLLVLADSASRYSKNLGSNSKNECLESKYAMNSTPLNAAIASMATVIPQFRAKTGVQIVNTVILTDGDATDRIYHRWGAEGRVRSLYVSDDNENGYSRDFYEVYLSGNNAVEKFNGAEASLIRFLRVEADCNVIGFRIDSGRQLNQMISSAASSIPENTKEFKRATTNPEYVAAKKKFLRDESWVSGEEWFGYTEWFGVSNLEIDEADHFVGITADATKSKLAKALSAEISKNKSSRPLMARIAARVSAK